MTFQRPLKKKVLQESKAKYVNLVKKELPVRQNELDEKIKALSLLLS